MPNIIQTGSSPNFIDGIEGYSNGENVVESVLNRPITQLALNTGWLKQRILTLEASSESTFVKKTAFNKDFGTTAGTVAQGNDPRLSDARTPLPHSHSLSQINLDLQGQGYLYFNGTALSLNTPATTGGAVAWSSITGIPSSFASSVGLVSGLGTELAKKANTAHSHVINDVSGLRAELDSLRGSSSSVPTHTHTIAQVVGLTAGLAGKSEVSHTHTPAQITGLIAYVQANLPATAATATPIVRQSFVMTTSNNFTLGGVGTVFKVSANGFDLESNEWSQSGNVVVVPGIESGDMVLTYKQGSVSPTVSKTTYNAIDGTNVFAVVAGFTAWQVTVNGMDIDTFTQTGNNVSVPNLLAGDSVTVYVNKV